MLSSKEQISTAPASHSCLSNLHVNTKADFKIMYFPFKGGVINSLIFLAALNTG